MARGRIIAAYAIVVLTGAIPTIQQAADARKRQWLRSTGSSMLWRRPLHSSMVRCGSGRMRRAMSSFYNAATRHDISDLSTDPFGPSCKSLS